jgi:hypothetical protein
LAQVGIASTRNQDYKAPKVQKGTPKQGMRGVKESPKCDCLLRLVHINPIAASLLRSTHGSERESHHCANPKGSRIFWADGTLVSRQMQAGMTDHTILSSIRFFLPMPSIYASGLKEAHVGAIISYHEKWNEIQRAAQHQATIITERVRLKKTSTADRNK